MNSITIVGAGLSGSYLAYALGKEGKKVTLLERRGDLRTAAISAGRSINLALSTRGLTALGRVGLKEDAIKLCIPMKGRMIHSLDGSLNFQPYGREDQYINSISRRALNEMLLDHAEACEQVELLFEQPCTGFDLNSNELLVERDGKTERVSDELMVAADGAYSRIRQDLQLREHFNYQQLYLDYGYKELTIPPTADGDFALEPNALHIWPRHEYMMIALPNQDKTFTCTLFYPFEGEESFATLQTPAQVTDLFQRQFPDALALMPDLIEEFTGNPTGSLVTVRCFPHTYNEQLMMVGDAAHAVVPFYGQGMNASFEDCAVFMELLGDWKGSQGELLKAYEEQRKPNVDALSDLSLRNFVEMRSSVARPLWVWRKRLEKQLHKWMPEKFIPLYSMVSFSNIPYAEALERAETQDRWIDTFFRSLAILALFGLALWGWFS